MHLLPLYNKINILDLGHKYKKCKIKVLKLLDVVVFVTIL